MYYTDSFDGSFDGPVVYVLFHKTTKKFTIGVTDRASKALRLIHWTIVSKTSKNKAIRELAATSPDFYHVYYPFDDLLEAQIFCEYLIDASLNNEDYIGRRHVKHTVAVQGVPDKTRLTDCLRDVFVGGETRYLPRTPRPELDFPGFNTVEPHDVKGIKGLNLVHPHESADNDRTCSAYLIYFPKSGCFYVGSSGKTVRRLRIHLSSLTRGVHPNPALQAAFNGEKHYGFVCYYAKDRDAAYDIEQRILSENWGSGRLFNIESDARSLEFSEATKQKLREARKTSGGGATPRPVSIAGTIYPSINEGARALGIDGSTLTYRLDSPNFPDYVYVN